MGSVIGKQIHGKTYYYLVESRRVDGRPRITEQRYLGSAETIAAALDNRAGAPQHSRHLSFGDSAAVWATLRRLGAIEKISEVAGAKLATLLALAVVHRATSAQTTLDEWWPHSAASRFIRPRPEQPLGETEFWRATQRLDNAKLERIEHVVASAAHASLDDQTTLTVDIPNFATYATAETGAAIATGLTAVVTRDGAIPLASQVHRRDDRIPLPYEVTAARLARHWQPVTAVFDTGQHAQLDLDGGQHFVGAIALADHPALLARGTRSAVDQHRFPGLSALDTQASVFGAERRVVLTHSTRLHAAQSRGLATALSEATRQLDGMSRALATGRNRQSRQQVRTEIARITRTRWVDRVLSINLSGEKPAELRLEFHIDEQARARLDEEFFGKQLLVTDQRDWPVREVVTAHRARYHLDGTFRMLHGAFVAAPVPRWHWTPHRIALHSLVSTLATMVSHLMRQQADEAGINLSVRELFAELSGIGETVLRYPSTGGRPRSARVLTDRTPTQQRLYELFALSDYAP